MRREIDDLVSQLKSGKISRRKFIKVAGFLGLSIGAIEALLAGCAPAVAPTPTEAPAATPTKAPAPTATPVPPTATPEPVTVKLWWWGEEEIPGVGAWLDETARMYHEANPHITIEPVQQSLDTLVPAFEAAAEAKEGPDIAFVWPGGLGMPYVWKGDIAPLNDYLDDEFLALDPEVLGDTYQGKKYFLTWHVLTDCVMYNKELFAQAGLDPENPPTKWDEFLDACERFKAMGVTPIVMGFKDLWDAGILYMYMIQQNCDNPSEVVDACVGKTSFTDPKFLEMWERIDELNKKGYFNEDIMSLETFAADEPFVRGEAAIRPRAIAAQVIAWEEEMGEGVPAAMKFPIYGKGKLATPGGVGAWWPESFCITSFAAYPQEAADFLRFMYTEERANALHVQTGGIPGAISLLDTNLIEHPEVRKVFEWGYFLHYELIIPAMVDYDGAYVSIVDVVSGTKTPLEAAQFLDEVVVRWQQQNPDEYEHFLIWTEDIERLAAERM